MGNRNAFAFLFIVVSIFVTLFSYNRPETFPRSFLFFFWLLFPVILCLNGSRALWIAAPLLGLYLGVCNWRLSLKYVALPFCIGALLFLTLTPDTLKNVTRSQMNKSRNIYKGFTEEQDSAFFGGDDLRRDIIRSSLSAWRERPLLGTGLGGGMLAQKIHYGEILAVIDNSALWLLTDTGLIGLMVFLGCFIAMLLALWRGMKSYPAEASLFAHCALIVLLFFSVFSLVHELLYTRLLWFILGLSLATPRAALSSNLPEKAGTRKIEAP